MGEHEVNGTNGEWGSLPVQWLAIVNPRSGHRKNAAQMEEIEDSLREILGDQLDVHVTEYVGDAYREAKKRRDVDGFIAVGGDGTLFDLINGMDLQKQKLAIFPAGTGNGFARALGILDKEVALAALQKGEFRHVDLIEVDAQFVGGEWKRWHVASTASLGYTSDVVELANAYFKPLGPLCYPIASVLQALLQSTMEGRWRQDDSDWQHLLATNVVVNNTIYAGDFEVFPEALIDDEKADVGIAKTGFFTQVLHNLSILSRLHLYTAANIFKTGRIEFELNGQRLLMLDGEIFPGITKASFAVSPKCLEVVALKSDQ